MNLKYRSDIDGLRAVAVGSVLAFHFGVPFVSGGFVGVDVFFVISGFLITTILLGGLEGGSFSIVAFYERRARRILPALFSVLAVTLVWGACVLFPHDFADLGKSAIAAIAFCANFFFWTQSGYFQGVSGASPLLHTWSLAVEEQFYLFFPIILYLSYRFLSRRMFVALFYIVLLGSFATSVYGADYYPTLTFYFPGTRAWELMLGAAVAKPDWLLPGLHFPKRTVVEAIAVLGIVLIVVPVFTLNADSIFPGWNALWPCLGSALIIWAGLHHRTFVAKGLGQRPLVFIGLISYSLYLWHWPVWVLLEKTFPRFHEQPVAIALVAAAVVVFSWVSWRYVERPFRSKNGFNRQQIFTIAGSTAAVSLAVLTVVAIRPATFALLRPSPGQKILLAYENYRDRIRFPHAACYIGRKNPMTQSSCNFEKIPPALLVWGDSFGEHLLPGLLAAAGNTESKQSIVEVTDGGCPPFVYPNGAGRLPCARFSLRARNAISKLHPQAVAIAARWTLYASGRWGIDLDKELAASIAFLHSAGVKRIYIVGELPTWPNAFPEMVMHDFGKRMPPPHAAISLSKSLYDPALDANLRTAAQQGSATYLSVTAAMCPHGQCPVWAANGEVVQWDSGHLTIGGSEDVVRNAFPSLRNVFAAQRYPKSDGVAR